jgi:hypothetical protein
MNSDFSDNSLYIINKIAELEDMPYTEVTSFFSKYHKKLKKSINGYDNKDGLSDYKLKSHDLIILFVLCKESKTELKKLDKLNVILVFMYSYYKLDDFYFQLNKKTAVNLLKLMNDDNIHSLIYNLVTNDQFLRDKKHQFNW